MDWITLKMTSGPWWVEYRNYGEWSNCIRVASGPYTLTNLKPDHEVVVRLYGSAACSKYEKYMGQHKIKTLDELSNPDKCWNAGDCRDIDNPDNFNGHTHKRQSLDKIGVMRSDCSGGGMVTHNHTWPDGGQGQHWHCTIYDY